MKTIDDTDKKILSLLYEDGRMTHEAISKQLDMTRPGIHKRVHKLMDNGYIDSFSTRLNWDLLGYTVNAYVNLKVNTKDFNQMIQDVLHLSDEDILVLTCDRITGPYCLLLHVRCRVSTDLMILHDKLLAMDGIEETQTTLILQTENLRL